jgi:hypothetical protein
MPGSCAHRVREAHCHCVAALVRLGARDTLSEFRTLRLGLLTRQVRGHHQILVIGRTGAAQAGTDPAAARMYLPTNLSRPEIASELSVSPNTVSAHIRSIYAKLQVRDRSSAVRRARELRLLAAPGRMR